MADHTMFYSWQSDSPDVCNRVFIRKVMEGVIKSFRDAPAVEDSPRLDSGMKGVAGSPEVATVMFEKIESASMFLGDVTLTGTATRADGGTRRMPNSNVAVEMGFAAGVLGWDRVICVMNTHYGKPEEQPFDVRNRRFPITYELAPDADGPKQKEAFIGLAKDFKIALRAAELAELARVDRAIARMDVRCLNAISIYGGMNHFAEHSEFAKTLGDAIPRLLDLGLIYTDVAGGLYAYHWTYLGRKVIAKKFPEKIAPAAPAAPAKEPASEPSPTEEKPVEGSSSGEQRAVIDSGL